MKKSKILFIFAAGLALGFSFFGCGTTPSPAPEFEVTEPQSGVPEAQSGVPEPVEGVEGPILC